MLPLLGQQLWATVSLTSWYLRFLAELNTLPEWVKNPDTMQRTLDEGGSLVYRLNNGVRDRYNAGIKELGDTIKQAGAGWYSFNTMMVAFFVLRVITIALAFMHPDRPWLVVLVSLGQFVIMPYSFFSSVVGLITMIPPLFLGHVMIFGGLQFMLNRLPVELPSYAFLTIDARFIGIFFLLDQAACWVCVWLPGFDKKAEPLPWKSIFTSVVYGAFNCKSYFLVLLLLMQGFKINLLVWALDAAFSLSHTASLFLCKHLMHWSVLFYHQHRLAHLPIIYEHAHKAHHYLRDVTAFDADIYGAGAPEEWGSIMAELAICLGLGITPPCLSLFVLRTSVENKADHTRKVDETGGVNMHVDHHKYHNRNFALLHAFLDMYMETATDNDKCLAPGYSVEKVIEGDESVFIFTPVCPPCVPA